MVKTRNANTGKKSVIQRKDVNKLTLYLNGKEKLSKNVIMLNVNQDSLEQITKETSVVTKLKSVTEKNAQYMTTNVIGKELNGKYQLLMKFIDGKQFVKMKHLEMVLT